MKKDRTKRYLAYGAGILVFCALFALNDARHVMAAKARGDAQKQAAANGEEDGDDAPSKSGKSATRAAAPKPANDKELEKFSRFFLPPIKLEQATIGEAVAAIVAAYRETAAATGETALDLSVELGSARTRRPITCTTPRAPAGSVIRYVAALAGNRSKGSLPNFRLEALSNKPDRSGRIEVPPGWESQLADFLAAGKKASEARLGEDPFAHQVQETGATGDPSSATPQSKVELRDLLVSLGFNPALVCDSSAPNGVAYENMSEAELEWLGALVETSTRGGLGPVQIKTHTKVLMVPDSLADLLNSGDAFNDGQVQLMMRKFASTQGVDLMTLPAITARESQVSSVEIVNPAFTPEGDETWTGVRMVTTAVPYGLGSQVEFAFKTRGKIGAAETQVREQVTLPENGNGMAIAPMDGGQKLIVLQGNTLIDATGRPIGPPP